MNSKNWNAGCGKRSMRDDWINVNRARVKDRDKHWPVTDGWMDRYTSEGGRGFCKVPDEQARKKQGGVRQGCFRLFGREALYLGQGLLKDEFMGIDADLHGLMEGNYVLNK
uniref:Transposase n=1 Tax=Panagrellus redivivus TaxID=6233 RepID=A0A7E4VV92_PANRE